MGEEQIVKNIRRFTRRPSENNAREMAFLEASPPTQNGDCPLFLGNVTP
jgi:hypothetical protein